MSIVSFLHALRRTWTVHSQQPCIHQYGSESIYVEISLSRIFFLPIIFIHDYLWVTYRETSSLPVVYNLAASLSPLPPYINLRQQSTLHSTLHIQLHVRLSPWHLGWSSMAWYSRPHPRSPWWPELWWPWMNYCALEYVLPLTRIRRLRHGRWFFWPSDIEWWASTFWNDNQ